jgi:hypothetical protein
MILLSQDFACPALSFALVREVRAPRTKICYFLLVPMVGVEPTRLSSRDFESRVFASFTTSANLVRGKYASSAISALYEPINHQ